jgi:DNA-binding FrmR family transcriptional regulator
MKHPCHKNQIASIRRIKGQIEGVERMINEGKYCIDILNQIKAAKNAISSVEGKILKTHLEECIKESMNRGNDTQQKIDEILKVLKR